MKELELEIIRRALILAQIGACSVQAREALAAVERLEAERQQEHAIAVHATGCMDRGCRICNEAMRRYIAEAGIESTKESANG